MSSGFLNVLKPPGMTSHDVVDAVRRGLPRKTKVGHLGTLDPGATGVLPLAVGAATRLIPHLPDLGPKMKAYLAEVALGLETSTDDLEGEVLGVRRHHHEVVQASTNWNLELELRSFEGSQQQVPPQVSAVRVQGQRAYQKVRQGEAVELAARTVEISRCQLTEDLDEQARFRFFLECSSGTYVRSIARDLGRKLGVGGALAFLIRTKSGCFELSQAVTLEEIRAGSVGRFLMPEETPFLELPLVDGVKFSQKGEFVLGDWPVGSRFRTELGVLSVSPEQPGKARVEFLFSREEP